MVISKILNHADPSVAAVYDRHSYDGENWEALQTWESTLLQVVAPEARATHQTPAAEPDPLPEDDLYDDLDRIRKMQR